MNLCSRTLTLALAFFAVSLPAPTQPAPPSATRIPLYPDVTTRPQ